jgi:hypothetical protein
MTIATEVVTSFMEALEHKDFTRAAGYLSDDFVMTGFTPKPLDKNAFMVVVGGLAAGMPNLAYHARDIHEIGERKGEGSLERATIHITGTQTESFVLPPLGLPPIPQTAQSVSLPEEHWDYRVRSGKIEMISTDRVPGGGIKGLLHQLNIDIPIIH